MEGGALGELNKKKGQKKRATVKGKNQVKNGRPYEKAGGNRGCFSSGSSLKEEAKSWSRGQSIYPKGGDNREAKLGGTN